MQVAAKQKKLNSSSRQADLGNKAKLVVCADHVAQVGIVHIPYYILPPFQIISHYNFLGESKHLKFDQNYGENYKKL
jgi:hypothetical protein